MQIDIRSNLNEVMRDLDSVERKVLPKATNRTLNRVGATASTIIRRGVAREAGITQKALKKRGFFARFKSRVNSLTFVMVVKWGSIPLKDFNPRQTNRGVTAKAWGSRKVYDGAFIVDSLGRHVFVRKTDKRLPIKKLYGPIPARLAETDAISDKLNVMLDERLVREMDANIRFYAGKELARQRR